MTLNRTRWPSTRVWFLSKQFVEWRLSILVNLLAFRFDLREDCSWNVEDRDPPFQTRSWWWAERVMLSNRSARETTYSVRIMIVIRESDLSSLTKSTSTIRVPEYIWFILLIMIGLSSCLSHDGDCSLAIFFGLKGAVEVSLASCQQCSETARASTWALLSPSKASAKLYQNAGKGLITLLH